MSPNKIIGYGCLWVACANFAVACRDSRVQEQDFAREVSEEAIDEFARTKDALASESKFRKAIELDPTFPNPRYNLGVLAEQRRDWVDAVRWYEEFLSLDPDSSFAQRARERLARCREAIQSDKSSEGRVHRLYAEALVDAEVSRRAGNVPDAVKRISDALALDRARPEAYVAASMIFAAEGDFGIAIQLGTMAADLSPAESRAQILEIVTGYEQSALDIASVARAEHLSTSGRHAEAGEAYERAWESAGRKGPAGIKAALSQLRAGNRTKAVEILNTVKTSDDPRYAEHARRLLLQNQPIM